MKKDCSAYKEQSFCLRIETISMGDYSLSLRFAQITGVTPSVS